MNLASQSGEAGAGQLLLANFNQDNTEKEHKNSWSQTTPFGLATIIVLGNVLFVLIYKLKMVFEAPSALTL